MRYILEFKSVLEKQPGQYASVNSIFQQFCILKVKNKTIPLMGHGSLEGHEILRIPHCLDSQPTDGSGIVSLMC
jgi:hypothetical protein